MSTIAENLAAVRQRIAEAAWRADRQPKSVTLIAVSKNHTVSAIEEAYAAGQRDFGENYVQEAREKYASLPYPDIRWHIIGHMQTNKVRNILPFTHMVQSLDSAKLADEISRRSAQVSFVMPVLIQVSLAHEEQKSGVEPEELPALIDHVLSLPNLSVQGLMTMPPLVPADEARPLFARLRELRDEMETRFAGVALPVLSMGMSGDFEEAIAEGATMVRVGTAIFGERK